jgi:flagellar biosynthesis chaperone FliJ
MNEKKLIQLREEIEEAKEQLGQLKGRKTTLMEQLQEQFKVKTLAEAKKKLSALESEIEEMDQEIDLMYNDLQAVIDEQNAGTEDVS